VVRGGELEPWAPVKSADRHGRLEIPCPNCGAPRVWQLRRRPLIV
jgi:hypothetical protein